LKTRIRTPRSPTGRDPTERELTDSLPLLGLWKERWRRKLLNYDPDILVLQRMERAGDGFSWGTVFYSAAREEYKRRIGDVSKGPQASFDLDLMRRVSIGHHGGLVIAANPNSLFEGHLVIFPEEKREDLSFDDLHDMCDLAPAHPGFSFIHNMKGSAASIVDWAHFQAYPLHFPLSREPLQAVHSHGPIVLSVPCSDYPAFVISAAGPQRMLSRFLFELLGALKSGETPDQERLPSNVIWEGSRVWVVPRSNAQSAHAASYIGALEMGGLFCLPAADNLPSYLPSALREEARRASLHDAPELRRWFQEKAAEIAGRLG
jgi:hypothetical protein